MFSQAEVSLGQEWVRKLVILSRVTLQSLRAKIRARKIGINGRIKRQNKEVIKQGWGSFHSPPGAPGDLRKLPCLVGLKWLAFRQGTNVISKRQICGVFENVPRTPKGEPLIAEVC